MSDTRIEWAQKSWNPITGCAPVSEGCQNCYAERMTGRFWEEWGCEPPPHHFKVKFHADRLDEPLHWKKPARVFVCSMGDLFHEDVHMTEIAKVVEIIKQCPRHTFICLTKRPARMSQWLEKLNAPNLWLGVSVENQARANERIPILLQIPAAVHGVSIEPILGPIELDEETLSPLPRCSGCGQEGSWNSLGVNHEILHDISDRFPELCGRFEQVSALDWVIVGCESGPGRRPCKLAWIQSVVEQCGAAGVPIFVKQIPLPYIPASLTRLKSIERLDEDIRDSGKWRVSHDPSEWPEELRIREFPNGD